VEEREIRRGAVQGRKGRSEFGRFSLLALFPLRVAGESKPSHRIHKFDTRVITKGKLTERRSERLPNLIERQPEFERPFEGPPAGLLEAKLCPDEIAGWTLRYGSPAV